MRPLGYLTADAVEQSLTDGRTAGRPTGFSKAVRKAPVFYGLVAAGTVGGMALSLLSVNPITLLVFVAVVNGVAAAPFLVTVMLVSSDRRIMGENVNGKARRSSAGPPQP